MFYLCNTNPPTPLIMPPAKKPRYVYEAIHAHADDCGSPFVALATTVARAHQLLQAFHARSEWNGQPLSPLAAFRKAFKAGDYRYECLLQCEDEEETDDQGGTFCIEKRPLHS